MHPTEGEHRALGVSTVPFCRASTSSKKCLKEREGLDASTLHVECDASIFGRLPERRPLSLMPNEVNAGGGPEQGPSRLRVFFAGEADCRGLIAAEEAAKLVRMQTTSLRASVHFFLLAGVFRAAWNGAHGIRSMLMAYDQCVCA